MEIQSQQPKMFLKLRIIYKEEYVVLLILIIKMDNVLQ